MAKRTRPTKPTTSRSRPRAQHEGESRRSRASGDARPALLIVLATTRDHLEEAVAVLIDMGIAATVIQTKPLSTVLRDELPVFAGLASLLPKMPESRLLVSITTTELADRALEMFAATDAPSGSGIFVATIALRGFIGNLGKP